jgi:hypothetical protein
VVIGELRVGDERVDEFEVRERHTTDVGGTHRDGERVIGVGTHERRVVDARAPG